ncbi:hypothetical protein CTI12_AA147260 [Artemisia annua]|uniref:Uncharacterized protein n=1 Tax=Artemisia annua TaxID=35608 RepID=A0A2U1PI55_ARTAN|nr:hypothetical protein CTI12_AA147260 [Artemisia annua]
MAIEPNDVRLSIFMRLREELDVEIPLAEQLLNLFRRFHDRVRKRRPEIIRVGSLPDHPLIDYGLYTLERMTGADMRNANNLMLARNELLRSIVEKEKFINNYREM